VICIPEPSINLRLVVIEQFDALHESPAEDRRTADAESNL
jgi:hypothetical protein